MLCVGMRAFDAASDVELRICRSQHASRTLDSSNSLLAAFFRSAIYEERSASCIIAS